MRDYRVEEREDLPYKVLVDRAQVRPRPRARADGPQAHLEAGPPHLRRQGPPAARPRRHGNCNPVHLPRRDHEPHRRARRHRRRSDLFRLVTRHESNRKTANRSARRRDRHGRSRAASPCTGPRASCASRCRCGWRSSRTDGHDQRHAPDRPRPRPRAPRPHAHARREHGRGRHEGLREAPRDPGRRLPRRDVGLEPRAPGRLLAPGQHHAAHGDRVRGAGADADRSCAGSTSRSSVRPQPRSARCARPSRTRARASATRASTSAGRSVSAHEHASPFARRACAATAACAARSPARPSGRAWPCTARTAASSPSSIDDDTGKTLASAQLDRAQGHQGRQDRARRREVGKALAAAAKKAGIETVVFDRGGYLYHGRVKALAEGAREGGLSF